MALKLIQPHSQPLENMGIGAEIMAELMAFRTGEQKDNPARRPGLHGPYEEFTRIKTGILPHDYYVPGDPEPWGLLIEESRSNVLWQVLSGVMDHTPELAASYMALALDRSLDVENYAKELSGLHKDWAKFLDHAGSIRDHHHSKMSSIYRSVACPACSLLTAIACRDPGMNTLFKEMLPLSAAGRKQLLDHRGLSPLLNIMIPSSPAP